MPIFIADNREAHRTARNLVNVVDPSAMRLDGIGREPDQFHSTLGKFWLVSCQRREFGGAHWSIVLRMREENGPLVANPFMEVDDARRCLGLEIRGDRPEPESNTMAGISQSCVLAGFVRHREITYGGALGASDILVAG